MAGLTRMCGSFKSLHRRSSSESNPITLSGDGRASTSSSSGTHDYIVAGSDALQQQQQQDQQQSPSVDGLPGVKRVIVVVDQSRESRLALLWALTHVVHKLDVVTLLYVFTSSPPSASLLTSVKSIVSLAKSTCPEKLKAPGPDKTNPSQDGEEHIVNSLKSLCSERRPEVEVEAVVVEGDSRGQTIVGQAKKLEASVLVLGQRKPGLLRRLLRMEDNGLVDYCIQNAECLTLAVRRKSRRVGGYLINTKWQKNFWLLA